MQVVEDGKVTDGNKKLYSRKGNAVKAAMPPKWGAHRYVAVEYELVPTGRIFDKDGNDVSAELAPDSGTMNPNLGTVDGVNQMSLFDG